MQEKGPVEGKRGLGEGEELMLKPILTWSHIHSLFEYEMCRRGLGVKGG